MPAATLSEDRFKEFITVSVKYFSWETILRDAGIGLGSDKGEQYEITCPFHADNRPSMRLTKSNGVYHCFSCQRKGTYTKFLWELNGKNGSYSQFCEQILKAHPEMQAELKFNSLFVSEATLAPEFQARRVFNKDAHLGSEMPLTTLVSKVRKMDDTWENLVLSLTLLQQGLTTNNVAAVLQKRHVNVKAPTERISLMDIL